MSTDERQRIDIGVFFAKLRYRSGQTQREVGRGTGLGQNAITCFERGTKDFKFSTLYRMAKIFGYNLEIRLVPISGEGAVLTVDHAPEPLAKRTYAKKVKKPIDNEIQYDSDDQFDSDKEIAAMRERLGV